MTAYENTDKEIWRKIEGEYYSPRIFVTKEGNVGINVGGNAYVQSVEEWHKQADRIAELEKLVHQRFDDGKRLGVLETENKFKSPPCAWMVKTNDGKKLMLYGEEQPPKFADEVQAIPLYTTPQLKPLSDEEIKQIWYNLYPLSSSSYWDDKREGLAELKFARAIEERHGIK